MGTERPRPTLLYNKMPGTIIIQRNANIYSRWLVRIRNKFGWFRVDLNFNQVYITVYPVLFIQTDKTVYDSLRWILVNYINSIP